MDSENSEVQIIIDSDFEKKSTESFYDQYYAHVTIDEMKWRRFGAFEKCNSILELCAGFEYRKVVEIGCGLCNVISRLDILKFADEFYGIEVSPSAVRFIQKRVNIPRLKAVYLLDTSKTEFENDTFDLGILSHVIEHVSNPNAIIKEALRISKQLIIEVPLENCLTANLFSRMLTNITGRSRKDNAVGHIHFFNKTTIRNLIKENGGKILGERNYRSWRIFYTRFRLSTIISYFQSVLFHLIYKMTGASVVATHHALLVEKKSTK